MSYNIKIFCSDILNSYIFFTSLLLLIPQHNAIEQPKFWYEVILIFMLGFPFHLVFSTLQICVIVFKIPSLVSFQTILRLFFSCLLGFVVPYCTCYFIWTLCLGYNHPLPFIGFSVYPLWIIFMGRLWFEFPVTFRSHRYRKKGKEDPHLYCFNKYQKAVRRYTLEHGNFIPYKISTTST